MNDYPSPASVSPINWSKKMSEWLVFVLIVAGWIALQAWILPRFGVST